MGDALSRTGTIGYRAAVLSGTTATVVLKMVKVNPTIPAPRLELNVVAPAQGETGAGFGRAGLKYLGKTTTGDVAGIGGMTGFGHAEGRIAAGERRSVVVTRYNTLGTRKGRLQQDGGGQVENRSNGGT